MKITTETTLGIGALLALQLLTALAAIGLLARVSPAVERILEENVYSEEAVEDMLTVFTTPGVLGPDDEAAFQRAFERAEGNVTEDEEGPLLDIVREDAAAALTGDRTARRRVVQALQDLADVNRASMQRSDERARRLGAAGAWAAAMLGFVGFLVSVLLYRRLTQRLVLPLVHMDLALREVAGGDAHRRVPPLDGPVETVRLGTNINRVLDRTLARKRPVAAPPAGDRAVLLHVVDRLTGPVLLLDAEASVVLGNRAGLGVWCDAEDAVVSGIREAVAGGTPPVGWRVQAIPGTKLWWVEQEEPGDDAAE
ncbi:MAG: hypothetical protein H6733_07605 [Alphaproteobacteria bacterium]|nr:hypothetical protein [Alphaproteobacteria bacterium]